jgi:hypothetical protein
VGDAGGQFSDGGQLFRAHQLEVGLLKFLLHDDPGSKIGEDSHTGNFVSGPIVNEGCRQVNGDLFSGFVDHIELSGEELSHPSIFGTSQFLHDLFGDSLRINLGDMDLADRLFRFVSREASVVLKMKILPFISAAMIPSTELSIRFIKKSLASRSSFSIRFLSVISKLIPSYPHDLPASF